MKKNILILISTVLLVTGFVFAETVVEFDSSYVNIDTSAIKDTYTGVLPNLGFTEADGIAQKVFTYTGAAFYLDDLHPRENCLLYRSDDNTAKFEINKVTGDIFFHKGMAAYDGDGNTPGLPSKNQAPTLAKKHLKALGLEKNALVLNGVDVLRKAVYDGQTSKIYDKLLIVSFKRKLGGHPVLGASRVMALLGTDGELAGLIVRWYDVEKVKVSGVVKNVKDHLTNKIKDKQKDAHFVLVKKADLVMFDDGNGVIEPALFVQGEVTEGGATFPCDWMVPVLTNSKAKY
ncbi:MAG: hypothetical protein JSV88_20505 [Candidatus Aminicenantes bacterium]|nr:MAG: hypothetical protein JSV88_20505 [Candidatus Aminicenantes bacterium]